MVWAASMAASCAAFAARSGWRRGVLNLSFAGERERRWRGELRHRLESPGEQLEQARPALAQGQLAAKHWLEVGQRQHGSSRAGFVLLFFPPGASLWGGADGAVASLGVFLLFPLVGRDFRPPERAAGAAAGAAAAPSSIWGAHVTELGFCAGAVGSSRGASEGFRWFPADSGVGSTDSWLDS